MKEYPKADEQDWVLLRTLRVALEVNSRAALALNADFVKALLYLNKKVGMRQFCAMCEALHAESKGKQNG